MLLVYLASFVYIASGGFSWFFVKAHSGCKMPVEYSVFYRQLLTSFFMFTLSFFLRKDLSLNKKKIKLILIISFLYYFCYMLASYYGSLFLIAGLVSAISSTRIIFVEIFLSIYYKKRPSTKILISALMGAIGIGLLSKSNMKLTHINLAATLVGIGISFFSPVSNAATNVVIDVKKARKDIDGVVIIAYCSLIGSALVLILGLIRNDFYLTPIILEKNYLIGLLYLSVVSSGVASLCSYYLVAKIGSLKATYMSITHAPLALLLTVLLADGKFDAYNVTGMAFCIYSLYNGIRYQSRKEIYDKIREDRKKDRINS